MSAHRMKYAKFQMHERAMARERNAELNKQRKHVEREVKNMNEVKPTDVNEWDCPKPETALQRQILKARRKREKQNEEYVRKRLDKQEIVIPKNYEEASKSKSDKEDK
jgi:adenylate kinase family enzyme